MLARLYDQTKLACCVKVNLFDDTEGSYPEGEKAQTKAVEFMKEIAHQFAQDKVMPCDLYELRNSMLMSMFGKVISRGPKKKLQTNLGNDTAPEPGKAIHQEAQKGKDLDKKLGNTMCTPGLAIYLGGPPDFSMGTLGANCA